MPSSATSAANEATARRAEFGDASGLGTALPSVRVGSGATRQFLFETRPPLTTRQLVIAWRRFRRTQRSGPATELDIDATVAEQCRTGWLLSPAFVPARRNLARLLLLVDASPSMVAWRTLYRPLAESVQQSRLAYAHILYFDNDPNDGLFETPELAGWTSLDEVLRHHADCAVLVVGDAGAAHGRRDRTRRSGTSEFVHRMRLYCGELAWLNPMPRDRWGGADEALRPRPAMYELTDDGLTRAVDFLRGARAA